MGYRTLAECLDDLRRTRQLVDVDLEIDPHLELAAIQRRVYAAQGPALLFKRVKGCTFPVCCNTFGTMERARFLFRDALDSVSALVGAKVNPATFLRDPRNLARLASVAPRLLPKKVRGGPLFDNQTTIDHLPQIVSWPRDGGPFITLPAVYTEDPDRPGWRHSNLGMYRVQLAGNQYAPNHEIGLHYQIHRGIGVHHTAAVRRGEALRVNVIVGGPPALWFAAVMPLPEGLPELAFAGALGGRRVRVAAPPGGLPAPVEADFLIEGTIDPSATKPEGPFGDHLGYYTLVHDFPVLRVDRVWHRPGAIWPYTSVGRPPQEDTTFGALIHELTDRLIPNVLPGVDSVHAVDAAGVHPLLLAIGSERYTPYAHTARPAELLTQANAILGQGQMSLAKYLWIVARNDAPDLRVGDIERFFRHALERVDWTNDLHFQTRTTIDTLDYSGDGLNQGSKVVIAATGQPRRKLCVTWPISDAGTPLSNARLVMPGVLAVSSGRPDELSLRAFCQSIEGADTLRDVVLITLVDDADFTARRLNNWLWVTFTRSNPAVDIDGVGAFVENKHWGCRGPLVIDARIKHHHAPPLEDDHAVERRVDALAAPGGPLHGIY